MAGMSMVLMPMSQPIQPRLAPERVKAPSGPPNTDDFFSKLSQYFGDVKGQTRSCVKMHWRTVDCHSVRVNTN